MDPKQTLLDARAALQDGDVGMCDDLLAQYWQWRERGGFEPTMETAHGTVAGDAYAAALG